MEARGTPSSRDKKRQYGPPYFIGQPTPGASAAPYCGLAPNSRSAAPITPPDRITRDTYTVAKVARRGFAERQSGTRRAFSPGDN